MLFLAILAALPFLASAKTDLVGCTSSISGPSLVWYVPDTGELCDFLDCGGGRAPPKTTVPGCLQYSGTATYSPSYLPGYGPNGKSTTASDSAVATTTAASAPNSTITGTPSTYVGTASVASVSTSTITGAPQSGLADRNGLSAALVGAGIMAAIL